MPAESRLPRWTAHEAVANVSADKTADLPGTQQAATALKHTLSTAIPDRVVLWVEGLYRLEEAIDPRHLQHDSITLGHRVGTTHNSAALAEKGLEPTDPEAIHYLYYWMKMKQGETRILTLTHNTKPLATLDYDVTSKSIFQIENKQRATGKESHLPALCGALHAVRPPLALTRIVIALPPIAMNHILTNHILTAAGTIVPGIPDNIHEALAGTIRLDRTSTPANIANVIATPLITADITSIHPDQHHHIAGHSRAFIRTTETASFRLNHLQSGIVNASSAREVSLPLHKSGHVDAGSARQVSLPSHQSGNVYADSATEVSLPLHQSGNVNAYSAKELSLPSHRRGDVDARSAKEISLPLHQSGNVYANSAIEVSLPLHQSGDVYARSAEKVSLPLHQTGNVYAGSTREVSLPLHQTGNVDARSAEKVSLPLHQNGIVDAPLARHFTKSTDGLGDSRANLPLSL